VFFIKSIILNDLNDEFQFGLRVIILKYKYFWKNKYFSKINKKYIINFLKIYKFFSHTNVGVKGVYILSKALF